MVFTLFKLLIPAYSILISSIIFKNNLYQPIERSATFKNTASDTKLRLNTSTGQKNLISELLRFLKIVAASKPII